MPIGYLISTLLLGFWTCCALWPARLPGLVGYRVGFLINEAPFVAAYWLIASTLLAAGEGDLRTVSGKFCVVPAAVVMVGLGVIAWRSFPARKALAHVLPDALGPGWQAGAGAPLASLRRSHLRLAGLLLVPFGRRRHDVERVANIAYGDAGRMNLLDVYRHRSRPTAGPVLIHLHGGHFVAGAKNRESLPLLYRMASRGWLCISANYRLSPEASFPEHVIDLKRVLAWVRDRGADYGGDPTAVFVAGNSAGAWLAAYAALTPNQAEYQPGFEHADTSVAGAICLHGYYGLIDGNHPESSPLAHVNADAPPFLVIHGDRDSVTPVEGARELTERLRRASDQPVAYAELPGAQHTFDYLHSIRCDLTLDVIEDFTTVVRTGQQRLRAGDAGDLPQRSERT